jgi:two-component system OmpR family response regulator
MPRALVVEDSYDQRELFVHELVAAGFMVAQAADGAEGINEVRRFKPDAVVLDLMLPGVDGFTVARTVRALEFGHDVAIVAVTALEAKPLRAEAIAAGCDALLGKPVSAEHVVDEVQVCLGRRHSKAEGNG